MSIKTYRARSVSDALAQVKRDLGPDAVILHTRTQKVGGVLGLGARSVTEITATARLERPASARRPAQERRPERVPSQRTAAAPGAAVRPSPPDRDREAASRRNVAAAAYVEPRPLPNQRERDPRHSTIRAAPPADAAPPIRRRAAPAEDRLGSLRTAEAAARATPSSARGSAPERALRRGPDGLAGGQPVEGGIEDEMRSLKRMVARALRSSAVHQAGMSDALFECYLKLTEHELACELADEVVGRVRDELTPAELTDRETVRRAILRHLAARIPVGSGLAPDADAQRAGPRTIVLVGPTGVGKTTTLAKLAATCKLRQGRRVGLVTCDTYRIAAVDQLRTYANIIGLPIKVALTPGEMRQACAQLADRDIVLVDTAGRSQRDGAKLEELQALVAAARPDEVHLVLSGTSSEGVLREAVERFAPIGPDHVIFTKLDEAVSFGVLVNTIHRIDARLSYCTTGQEVPDQIEPGSADRLARLVLDGRGC